MTTILRPGQRILNIPGIGVSTSRRAVASAAGVDWSQWFDHVWIAKGAASLAASYASMVGSTTLTEGAAPTLEAGGWLFSGTYLLTGLIPTSDWTMMVQYTGANSPSGILCGTSIGNSPNYFISPDTGTWAGRVFYGHNGGTYVAPAHPAGNLCVAGANAYRDGVADGALSAWSGTNSMQIGIGAAGDGSNLIYGATVVAFGLAPSTLNATQVALAHAAMAAL